ncbi:DUF6175 family protein [Bacteroides caecicola]|uniref:DUF6175 family protein n=1 Tax=Bacteroides caecicola TaxID=1462569 RepID=UPI0020127282|nr:DUF6175 family protein [Bacteroides caecicola]MCL1626363.1 DUF6175 family protein [Bacteroides caecicola]
MKSFFYSIFCVFFFIGSTALAQVKKPTIMVIPADAWCSNNNYMTSYMNQGIKKDVPDYKAALQNDIDLLNVITKIGELMAERGFPLKDLSSTIRDLEQSAAENEMLTSSTSGALLAETPYEKLLNRAKADILIELVWKINTTGPKRSVTYTLRGIDAYTNKQVAAATGTGEPSLSAETPVLLEEAVLNNMDNFASQLQAHFDDLMVNGREVTVEVQVFDNGLGTNLESEFDGEMLTDIIDEWMYNNTMEHRYNLSDATENHMLLEQVRIPLYNEKGRPMDTRNFANDLRRFLRKAPYNVECKLLTKGLGKAILVIGEK